MRAGLLMAEREHFIQTQVFAGGPKKDIFILHCAHLIVPLQSQKAANNGKKSFDNRSRGIHWRISGG
ncbi:MAG: hypothetical protein IJ724_05355, partial [Muribaculaceae bacterium]|nr:hypothetical protein [Muribaculaceae bacterium]